MTDVRRDVVINEVSLCRDPVNPMARVALVKSLDPEPGSETQTDDAKAFSKNGGLEPIAQILRALADLLMGENTAIRMPVGREVTEEEPQLSPKLGRPRSHDWDALHREMIRIANTPDGLPESQADLVRRMSDWWQEKFGYEPANSLLREKISLAYRYIKDADNP